MNPDDFIGPWPVYHTKEWMETLRRAAHVSAFKFLAIRRPRLRLAMLLVECDVCHGLTFHDWHKGCWRQLHQVSLPAVVQEMGDDARDIGRLVGLTFGVSFCASPVFGGYPIR